jgi:hypothetical protein
LATLSGIHFHCGHFISLTANWRRAKR